MQEKFVLTPEEEAIKAKYQKQFGCEIEVVVVPMDRTAKTTETLFLKEPTLAQMDVYASEYPRHPILACQSLFATLLIASDEDKTRICGNKYAVMSIRNVIDKMTEFFVAVVKKSKDSTP